MTYAKYNQLLGGRVALTIARSFRRGSQNCKRWENLAELVCFRGKENGICIFTNVKPQKLS